MNFNTEAQSARREFEARLCLLRVSVLGEISRRASERNACKSHASSCRIGKVAKTRFKH